MNNDLLFLILAIVVLIVFGVIVGYWFYTSSKDYVVNNSIKGFYQEASLNQRCSVSKNENETLMLPQYYEPQGCGFKQKCIITSSDDIYGYCKADIGGICYNVYDCAPPDGNTGIFCNGGICSYGTTGIGGVLFSSCGAPSTIGNSFCDSQLGLICNQGTCLYIDGQACIADDQCNGKKCILGNNGATGICTSQIPAASYCDVNYCQTGFGCDFINGNNGYCQPFVKTTNGATGVLINTGEKGALCSIPLYSTPTNLPCNGGLVCNFDPMTMNSFSYPGLTGYGICQEPLIQVGENCSTSGSACIPPAVCSTYNATIPYCQAPRDNNNTGFSNINYCGYGSTTQCGVGYSCVNDYCMPNSENSLCGGSGVCLNSLTCGNNKLGIFTPIRSGGTGVPSFGSWQYIDLPSSEITLPSSESFISSYQFMDIDNGEPVIKTKVIYLPSSSQIVVGSTYFWYLDLINNNGVIINNGWSQITISNYTFGYLGEQIELQGIKFTPSGNISINVLFIIPNYSHVYVYNFNPSTFSGSSIDLSSGNITNGIATSPTEYPIIDWDVDDRFNLQSGNVSGALLVNGLTGTNSSTVYYGSLNNIILTGITNNYTYMNSSSDKLATFVRYIYNYKSSSNGNFIFNGTTGVNNSYNLIIPNVSTSQNILLPVDEEFFNGVGLFPTYLNNINDLEFYYLSNRGFRYYNAVSNNSSTSYNSEDVPIQGYTPNFDITSIQSSTRNTLTYGNIDRSLYSLITLCS